MAVTTTEPAAVAVEAARPLRGRRLRLPRSPKVLIGLGLLIIFLIIAVIGPLIAPYNPSADLAASGTPQPPSAVHWLGTTQTQQDVLSQLLTEIVFSYPGIGFVLYQAVINHDAPLMQGIFLIITVAVLAANLIADFAYLILDPRTRQEA